ncbi:MAG: translation elongation factor-like protein [Candidatus Omnitrophica bacterium]|nr:translation elongation factor-like protein [Candidatus Omnitrophota bacterium]MCM8802418.1 translation elongation factor-like protein [Candidatus Omnitrophota bacterium]
MKEIEIGKVSHYYTKISVAAIKITRENLRKGDKIHIKGHTTDLSQTVESMQKEHQEIEIAKEGDEIGIKVNEHVREGDIVYKIIEE